jgi:hypothetical protein
MSLGGVFIETRTSKGLGSTAKLKFLVEGADIVMKSCGFGRIPLVR